MKKKILLFLYFVSFQLVFVVSIFGQTLEMPQGFRVQIYAEIHSARQMALADNGVVFVGTENGKIYALVGEPNSDIFYFFIDSIYNQSFRKLTLQKCGSFFLRNFSIN